MTTKETEETPVPRWRTVVEQFKQSGLRMKEFCQQRGIPPGTLSHWKWRYDHPDAPARPPRSRNAKPTTDAVLPALLPVTLTSPRRSSQLRCFEVALASGRRLRFGEDFEEQALLRLVRLLESA